MYDDMKGGWKWLTGDASWEDHGGQWVKRLKGTKRYFVIRFDSYKDDSKELRYCCDVMSVNIAMTHEQKQQILKCYGHRLVAQHDEQGQILGYAIESESGDVLAGCVAQADLDVQALILVECAVGYGAYAPHHSFESSHRPLNLRAQGRRAAEALMRDEADLERSLARPVNAIGSTALEYERGDIMAALTRDPDTTQKGILRKMGTDKPHCPKCGEPARAAVIDETGVSCVMHAGGGFECGGGDA
jgi:hypothetical protein